MIQYSKSFILHDEEEGRLKFNLAGMGNSFAAPDNDLLMYYLDTCLRINRATDLPNLNGILLS